MENSKNRLKLFKLFKLQKLKVFQQDHYVLEKFRKNQIQLKKTQKEIKTSFASYLSSFKSSVNNVQGSCSLSGSNIFFFFPKQEQAAVKKVVLSI